MSTCPAAAPLFSMVRQSKLDPPREFAEWRADHPLQRVTLWNGQEAWAAVGYDAVREVLRDHEHFSSVPETSGYPTYSETDKATKQSGLLTMVDPPVHTVLRKAVLGEFIVKAIEALRPDTELLVDELIEACRARYDVTVEEVRTTEESVVFKLPRALAAAADAA